MSAIELHAYATLALVGGPALFYGGFRDLRHRRVIQDTPTAKIRSMAMGLVEVNGTIEARSDAVAPFSGRPCAYWQVEIAMQSGRSHSWKTVHRNTSGNPFFLRDDTGVAMVYPKGSECHVAFGVEETCLGLSLPACYADYLKEHRLWMRHVGRLGAMRFRERTLEAGHRVYVLGTATPRAQVHTVSEMQLAATGTDDWRAGRIRDVDAEVSATIRQGAHEKTFIISQRSERDLTTHLGLSAGLKLFGGPALALAGLGYWLVQLAGRFE